MGMFSGVGGAGRSILSFGAQIRVGVSGLENVGVLGKKIDGLRSKFIGMGVTTIFLDRLVQSLARAWAVFNSVIGVSRLAEQSEQIIGLSKGLHIGTDQFQRFAGAVSVAGGNMEQSAAILQKMSMRVAELRQGEKGTEKMFNAINMGAGNFAKGSNSLDNFLKLIDQIGGKDIDTQVNALTKIFGDDLARKIGRLGNADDIKKAMQEAADSGAVLSQEQLKNAQVFAGAMRKIGRLFISMSNNIGSALLPVLTRATEVAADLVKSLSVFFNERATRFGEKLQHAFDPFINAFHRAKGFIDMYVKDSGEFIARLGQGLLIVVGILGALAFGKIIGAAVVVGAIVTALSFVIDDILTFMRGGQSLIGTMIADSPALQTFMEGIKILIFGIKSAAADIMESFSQLAKGPLMPMLIAFLGIIFGTVGFILAGAGKLLTFFVRIVNVVVELASIIGQLMGLGLGVIMDVFSGKGMGDGGVGDKVLGAMQKRTEATGGFSGALSNAFTGEGPTTTSLLMMGPQGGNTTVNQTNNITATSSNPEGFATGAAEAAGRGVASTVGG